MDTSTPLRRARLEKNVSLGFVAESVSRTGLGLSSANLSLVERGKTWPSKQLVKSLIDFYRPSVITEMEILYPERFVKNGN